MYISCIYAYYTHALPFQKVTMQLFQIFRKNYHIFLTSNIYTLYTYTTSVKVVRNLILRSQKCMYTTNHVYLLMDLKRGAV